MTDIAAGDWIIRSLGMTTDARELEVLIVDAGVYETTKGQVLATMCARLNISGSDVQWWKDRLGRRIRLVAQDL